jgi:low temperature requirement protein LtrA
MQSDSQSVKHHASQQLQQQQRQQHASEHHTRGRKLFGSPVLLQDWDDDVEVGAFQYWELFLDLLLVAAASSITDQFKANLTVVGFGEFVVFYAIILNGWLLYTHHITSRFQDNSLAHSMVLFFYCIGFGICIVNVGYQYFEYFCWGAVLQRASVVIMLVSVYTSIPRARYMVGVLGFLTIVTTLLLTTVAVWGRNKDIQESPCVMTLFWIAANLEFWGEVLLINVVEGRRMVPINIDQTKERLGAMELVMLGESVYSVCMIYRELLVKGEVQGEEEEETKDEDMLRWGLQPYYFVLGYSFLLIYMFLLLYFHMQPSPADHAFRRSLFHGATVLFLHKILGLVYLTVGTSIKLVVERAVLDETLVPTAGLLMGYGVGASILILFGMRWMHYAGRDHINVGDKYMHWGVDQRFDTLASMWWATLFIAGFIPIIGVVSGWTLKFDPVMMTAVHSGFVFLLVLLESFFSHAVQDVAARQEVFHDAYADHSEKQSLITTSDEDQNDKRYSTLLL